jgi:hypothetical protein
MSSRYITNNKCQKGIAYKQESLTTFIITIPLLSLLHVYIDTRVGPVRDAFVNPWRLHHRDLELWWLCPRWGM